MVEVPRETSSELVVKLTVVPESVQPEVPPPPVMHTPETAKQPSVKLKPLAKVLVATDVERIDPPVIVNPLDVDNPPVLICPENVEVAVEEEVMVCETTK